MNLRNIANRSLYIYIHTMWKYSLLSIPSKCSVFKTISKDQSQPDLHSCNSQVVHLLELHLNCEIRVVDLHSMSDFIVGLVGQFTLGSRQIFAKCQTSRSNPKTKLKKHTPAAHANGCKQNRLIYLCNCGLYFWFWVLSLVLYLGFVFATLRIRTVMGWPRFCAGHCDRQRDTTTPAAWSQCKLDKHTTKRQRNQ